MNKYELIFEAVQEALDNNEITLEEAEFLNDYAYDRYITESSNNEREFNRMKKLAKITDDSVLKETLINHASKSKFSSKTCKNWSVDYHIGSDEGDKICEKLKSMDLGTCYGDGNGNYVVYSFKTKKFYFFDHEFDGKENLSHTWTLDRIKQHINKWN